MTVLLPARLSAMMFLEFFIWGAWYVTVGNYMAAEGQAAIIYAAYTVGPVAALVTPFLLGWVADRFVAMQWVLAGLHVAGGLALFAAAAVGARQGALFIGLLLVHSLCYFPTLGLTSSLALQHLPARERQFPRVRAFGTVGWVAAGVVVSSLLRADETAVPLYVAAAASFGLGLYALTLPYTPPRAASAGGRRVPGMETFRLFLRPSFRVLLLASLLISVPLATYNVYAPVFILAAGLPAPGAQMALGQATEVLVMLAMPAALARWGLRWVFLAGAAAWGLRYLFFAAAPSAGVAWIVAGILLHGVAFNGIFITGQLFVDRQAPPGMRGQAQSLLVVLNHGLGQLAGAPLAGMLFNRLVEPDAPGAGSGWPVFWIVPAVACLGALLFFALRFRDEPVPEEPISDEPVPDKSIREEPVRGASS